jgi:hypothetical protein
LQTDADYTLKMGVLYTSFSSMIKKLSVAFVELALSSWDYKISPISVSLTVNLLSSLNERSFFFISM